MNRSGKGPRLSTVAVLWTRSLTCSQWEGVTTCSSPDDCVSHESTWNGIITEDDNWGDPLDDIEVARHHNHRGQAAVRPALAPFRRPRTSLHHRGRVSHEGMAGVPRRWASDETPSFGVRLNLRVESGYERTLRQTVRDGGEKGQSLRRRATVSAVSGGPGKASGGHRNDARGISIIGLSMAAHPCCTMEGVEAGSAGPACQLASLSTSCLA